MAALRCLPPRLAAARCLLLRWPAAAALAAHRWLADAAAGGWCAHHWLVAAAASGWCARQMHASQELPVAAARGWRARWLSLQACQANCLLGALSQGCPHWLPLDCRFLLVMGCPAQPAAGQGCACRHRCPPAAERPVLLLPLRLLRRAASRPAQRCLQARSCCLAGWATAGAPQLRQKPRQRCCCGCAWLPLASLPLHGPRLLLPLPRAPQSSAGRVGSSPGCWRLSQSGQGAATRQLQTGCCCCAAAAANRHPAPAAGEGNLPRASMLPPL